MSDRRTTDPLIDDPLSQEIERALAVDPSAEFLARVRTQVAALPAPDRGSWRLRWVFLTAGVAVSAGVIAMVLLDLPRVGDRQRQPDSLVRQVAPDPVINLPASSVEQTHMPTLPAATGETRERASRVAAPRRGDNGIAAAVAQRSEQVPPFPEVLLPAEEIRAWRGHLSMFETATSNARYRS